MPDSNMYGSPMKILEYMSMGVPVVAPDYPPILDVITNMKEGIIFERRNQESMTGAFKKLFVDENFRRLLSQNARDKIVEDRNWKNNAIHSIDGLV